jgi:hypothetical protein
MVAPAGKYSYYLTARGNHPAACGDAAEMMGCFLTVVYGMNVSMVDFYGICGTVVGWNPMGMLAMGRSGARSALRRFFLKIVLVR